jgi:Tol biopolymer transport system component
MYCPLCRLPILRRLRAAVSRLVALIAALAIGACAGGDNPLAPAATADQSAPAEDPMPAAADPASDSVAPDNVITALTTQRIVFTSTRNGNYDIFKMDPQGGSIAPLATSGDMEWAPAWSRDNRYIAMNRPRWDPIAGYHYDIYLINADGSDGHWVRSKTAGFDMYHPSWSPDGTRLALSVTVSGALYVGWMSVTTGMIGVFSTAYGGLQGKEPAYTPAGQIVYVGATGKTVDRINADGSGHKTLVSSSANLSQPSISPDGKRLAYVKMTTTINPDIYVKNLVDGTSKRLTTFSGDDWQPTWSPDGTKLAFTSSRSGGYQIWTMSATTGGSLTRITHTSGGERDPMWSH